MALRCCCCCGPRGGALATGILFLVLSLLHLLGVIIGWGIVETLRPVEVVSYGVDTHDGGFGVRVRQGDTGDDISVSFDQYGGFVSPSGDISLQTPFTEKRFFQASASEPQYSPHRGSWLTEVVLIPQTVLALLSVLFNSMLIRGVNSSSSCAVLSWLIYYGVLFVLFALGSLGLLIACFVFASAAASADGRDHRAIARVFALVYGLAGGVGLLLSALFWYSWAVVLAFLQQLNAVTAHDRPDREEVPLKPASPTQPHPPTYAEATAPEASTEETRDEAREKSERF